MALPMLTYQLQVKDVFHPIRDSYEICLQDTAAYSWGSDWIKKGARFNKKRGAKIVGFRAAVEYVPEEEVVVTNEQN